MMMRRAGAGPPPSLPQTELQFVASGDSANNTYSGSNLVHIADDSTVGAGRFLTISSGTVAKLTNQVNGLSAFDLSTAGNNFPSQFTVILKGGMTAFLVWKYSATGSYQSCFDSVPNDNPCSLSSFAEPGGGIQGGGNQVASSNLSGAWMTTVLHYYPSLGHLGIKCRVNGALASPGTGQNNSSSGPQGSSFTPASVTMGLFGRQTSTLFPFHGLIAEIGFYAINLDGSEASLEAYLRAKYATW